MLHEELTTRMDELGAGPEFVQGLQERIELVQGDIRHYEDKVRHVTLCCCAAVLLSCAVLLCCAVLCYAVLGRQRVVRSQWTRLTCSCVLGLAWPDPLHSNPIQSNRS